MVADCLSRQTWPSTQTVGELPDALTTLEVVSLQDGSQNKDRELHSQDRLHPDRPLPRARGEVGVLTPRSPETPTLSGDTIGRQQADIYPYMDEPQTRQDDHPDRH